MTIRSLTRHAVVEVLNTDRYGRTVGVVNCGSVNANEIQVRTGMAWVYRKYANELRHLYPLEDNARANKLGLWA